MKLFVIGIMFAMASFAFSDDPPQERTTSPQEPPPPNHQAQSSQDNSGNMAAGVQVPTGNPVTSQPTTEHDKGNPAPIEKGGDGKPSMVAFFSLFVSVVSVVVALRSMFQTDKTRRITERAYLAAEQWEVKDDSIVYRVANRGRTPATLLSGYTEYTLWTVPPAATPETERRVDRDFGESDLPAQGVFPMQVGTLGQEEWKEVKNYRTLTLRVAAHIRYRDVFGEIRPMRFVMEYDGRIREFVLADKRASVKKRK